MAFLIEQTAAFAAWHMTLRDLRARIAVARRIERAAAGNLGDTKSVGGGISEMRVATGPGYRLYFTRRRGRVILLLWGGAKRNQQKDILRAQRLAAEI